MKTEESRFKTRATEQQKSTDDLKRTETEIVTEVFFASKEGGGGGGGGGLDCTIIEVNCRKKRDIRLRGSQA